MSEEKIMMYFLGGPWDLSKKVMSNPPDFLRVARPLNLRRTTSQYDMVNIETGTYRRITSPLPVEDLYIPASVYIYEGDDE